MTRIVRRTPKIDAEKTLGDHVAQWTNDERTLMVAILRRFTGSGPYAELNNLKFWRTHHALACIKKSFRGLKPEYRAQLRALESKIVREARS